MYVFNINSHYT